MKSLVYMILLVALITGVASCVRKSEISLRGEARELYLESRRITGIYLDSISKAQDSASLLGMCERYDEAITRLNYSHAAGADYDISEGENDTLINLSGRFIALRDSLLYQYAHRAIYTDSVSADSIF